MNRLLTVSLILYQLLALAGAAAAEEYTFLQEWGDPRPPLWTQLSKPRGVAVSAANGNVYVSASAQNSVFMYNPNGTRLASWSNCDGIPGDDYPDGDPLNYLNNPMEMAVDITGNLYVVDTNNNRICVYTANGVYQRRIEAGFNAPVGVAVDNDLNIYVTDRGNHAVKKLSSLGSLLQTWNGFTEPWGVAIYGNNVYVTDGTLTGMVHKLGMNGTHIQSWGPRGLGDAEFLMAEGIAAHNNLLYVSDGEYGRIHVFDLNGNFQKTIGERGTGNGQLQFSTALAVDAANGWLYVSDDDNDRVVKFDLKTNPPSYAAQWGCDSAGTTGLRYPTKIAVDDARGVMYVVDSANHRIRKMTLHPNVTEVLSFGGYGNPDGRFRFPLDAAVDSKGNVYVVDNLKRNVQKFSPGGVFIQKYDFNQVPLLYLYGLHAIAIDASDKVYVVDAGTNSVHVLDASGNKIGNWAVNEYPTGIAIDEVSGFVYVTSFFPDVATQYFMNGTPTGKMIGQGNSNPFNNLFHPYSVTVDVGGNILIADTFRNRLNKFGTSGPAGDFFTTIGTLNWAGDHTPGQFTFPYGVALDSLGNVYAADTNNHRIQIFKPAAFSFTAATHGSGAIGCSPTVNYGGQQVCTIAPAAGYYLSSLTDNGQPVAIAPGEVYTLSNVAADHLIDATFQPIHLPPVRVASDASQHDNIMPAYSSLPIDDDVIELQPITYPDEGRDFNSDVRFTLKGGVDFMSLVQSGYSIITTTAITPVIISRGTATMDGIIIK